MASEADIAEHGSGVPEAAAPGMPQLDFTTFPNQIFWLVLTLIAIYLVISKIALPRIGGVLADRQRTIADDIAAAESIKSRAQEAEEAYHKALADARVQAGNIIAEAKNGIQKELDAANAEADERIAASAAEAEKSIAAVRDGAERTVSEVAHEIAKDVVAATAPGIPVDDTEIAAAVERRLKGDA